MVRNLQPPRLAGFGKKYKSLITLPHAAGTCQALLRCSLALSAAADGALET